MDAFSQLDLAKAMIVLKDDELGRKEVDEFIRNLVNRMTGNLRIISYCVELISMAKSLELISNNARYIAELVVYVLRGTDVSHTPIEQIESVGK